MAMLKRNEWMRNRIYIQGSRERKQRKEVREEIFLLFSRYQHKNENPHSVEGKIHIKKIDWKMYFWQESEWICGFALSLKRKKINKKKRITRANTSKYREQKKR